MGAKVIALVSLSLLYFSQWALAQGLPQLPEFPQAAANPVVVSDQVEPTCAEIIPRLEAYRTAIIQNDDAILGFVDQVAQTAINWHQLLVPLENTSTLIPGGTFSPLKDYGDKIGQVVSWGYDNRAYFETEIETIIGGLRNCNLQSN